MSTEGGMSGKGFLLIVIICVLGFFGIAADTGPGLELLFIVITFLGIAIVYQDYRWLG